METTEYPEAARFDSCQIEKGLARNSACATIGPIIEGQAERRIEAMAERPPLKLQIHGLAGLLAWYEKNLCGCTLRDPRGHEVKFDIGRFAYMIKLKTLSGKKVRKPSKIAERIKSGKMTNADFGGFDEERAATLSWIPSIILRPTFIATNKNLLIPGDELYLKELDKSGYKYKVLYCKRVSDRLLVPVTSFPRSKIGGLAGGILWPKTKGPPIAR